jgi:hypothetical protein
VKHKHLDPRASTGSVLDRSMVARTKSKIACFAGPSFQDGSKPLSAVAVCARAAAGRSALGIASDARVERAERDD